MVKKLQQKFIKINTKEGSGTMKIFGDELNPSIPYKTFLLSIQDTAEWIIKEMLEKYGLKHENPENYCLLQIIIPSYTQFDNKIITEIILHDKECPLNIYLNLKKKKQGSIIFKVIKSPPEYIEIYKKKLPSIQDRMINTHLPMFIEVNNNGTDLPTPRVVKLHPNITYVGRYTTTEIGKQYFYIDGIDIDHDHCIIQNQNNIVTLIPHGKTKLNGKFISTSFILQHGSLICFGENLTFRYYDQQFMQRIKLISKQKTKDKLSIYNSLPIELNKINNNESKSIDIQQEKRLSTNFIDPGTKINALPGLLEVSAETETLFLQAVFDNYSLNNIHFRLSPVYTLYMTLRHRLSSYRKTNISFVQKQNDALALLYRIEDMINKKIEECQNHAGYLTYWLANISELIYFLKQDQDLLKISNDIQINLIKHIQRLFNYLINIFQNELNKYLIAFINPEDIFFNQENNLLNQNQSEIRWIILDKNSNKYNQLTLNNILEILSSILDLLCKCRINPVITIEIFSHIFQYINIWLFNRIVCYTELKLCSKNWGEKFLYRLKYINDWAKTQGLEITSECYLMKLNQLCLLLKCSKHDIYDLEELISNNIFKINSIQVKQILNNYILSQNEPPISNDFCQALLSIAYKHVDENLHRTGCTMQLAEEQDLNLSLLLPEDGYTCEYLRDIPEELFKFIELINQLKLCRLFTNPYSLGMWTEFMQISNVNKERIETIILNKKDNNLGLIIVSAKNEYQQYHGIYIKGIISNSAAENDGRLQPGDQILSVDKISLINMTQEQAVQLLKQCGPSVTLKILKNAVNLHDLSALLPTSSENRYDLAYISSISNPSLMLHQYSPTTFNHQRLSTVQQQDLVTHHPFTSSVIQSSNSNEISMNRQTNHYIPQQYQSNPNLFNSKQQFNNYENNLQSKTSFRSTNPLVFREDIPPDQNKTYHSKSTIIPKILPKSMIGITASMKQTNSISDVDISGRLSSSSNHSISSLQKSRIEHQKPIKLVNTRQHELNSSLKFDDEFDRRLEEFPYRLNEHNNQEIYSSSSNEFDEKLKRRLEQFEKEREIERIYINQMLTKRQADFEERLRKNREREIHADRDMQEYRIRRMSTEERILEAKKEQNRLLKYVLNKSSSNKLK